MRRTGHTKEMLASASKAVEEDTGAPFDDAQKCKADSLSIGLGRQTGDKCAQSLLWWWLRAQEK